MDEEPKPPAKANLAPEAPSALPPATGGAAQGTSPVVWIVAAVVGMAAVGGLLFGCLICAGVAFLTTPMNVQSEMNYAESMVAPPKYEPYGEAMPIDAWSGPGYSGEYSTEAAIAPYEATPADAAYDSTYAESLYSEEEQPYDPDWQLELPQYQQDAIRDLNNQRETFGTP